MVSCKTCNTRRLFCDCEIISVRPIGVQHFGAPRTEGLTENIMRHLASFVLPILVAASTSGVLFTATLI